MIHRREFALDRSMKVATLHHAVPTFVFMTQLWQSMERIVRQNHSKK